MTLCLTSERDSLSRNKELKFLWQSIPPPGTTLGSLQQGYLPTPHIWLCSACFSAVCGGYSEKRTGGKICSGPFSEVEHRGLC